MAFRAYLVSIKASAVVDNAAAAAPELTATGLCNQVWPVAEGGCCVRAELQATFTASQADRHTAWAGFVSGLSTVSDNFIKLNSIVTTEATLKTDLDAINAETTVVLKTLLEGLTTAQATTALAFAKTYNDSITSFKTTAKPCYDAEVANVAKIWCYGCSNTAANNAFVAAANGVASITPASAEALYKVCYKAWKFIDDASLMIQIVAAVNKKRKAASTAVRPAVTGNTGVYFDAKTETDVMALWAKCMATDVITTACVAADIASIVRAHFNTKLAAPRLAKDNLVATAFDSVARRMLAVAADYTGAVLVTASTADLVTAIDSPVYAATFVPADIKMAQTIPATTTTGTTTTGTTAKSMTFINAVSTVAFAITIMLNLN